MGSVCGVHGGMPVLGGGSMAVLIKRRNQSSHWYRTDGTPCHRLPCASGGGLRATTIRDAKELGLYPSVTSILGIVPKPALDKWRLLQVALASQRLTRSVNESDHYFARRIVQEAFTQVADAANLGSQVHSALEKVFDGEPVPEELSVYTDPVLDWKESKRLRFVERELCVVNKEYGFAGTMDVACCYGSSGIGVIDFKTRKTKQGEKVFPYDGQAMQIAAYGATYWGEENLSRMFGANVYISSTEPGRMEVCAYRPEELVSEFEAFKHVCAVWRHFKGYDPRLQEGGQQ